MILEQSEHVIQEVKKAFMGKTTSYGVFLPRFTQEDTFFLRTAPE